MEDITKQQSVNYNDDITVWQILDRTEVTTMTVGATIQPPVTYNDDRRQYYPTTSKLQ